MSEDPLRILRMAYIIGQTSALLYDLQTTFEFTEKQKKLLENITQSIESAVYKDESLPIELEDV